MKRLCIAALLAGTSFNAHAIGRMADVSIVDRETGAVIATHYYKGEYWIAGAPGARYEIAIRNRFGERILAVTAVDGVNVISGDTAGWDQTGYVFGPGQRYEIAGWRKSDTEIASFEFTEAPKSYAALTGRAANVGVIGVALFRERIPQLPKTQSYAVEPPPARFSAPTQDATASASAPASPPMELAKRSAMNEKLGTGHGQRETSNVVQTDFDRLQSTPNELIRLRYDSLENLIAMGVVGPEPFPDSPLARFVPDPPERR